MTPRELLAGLFPAGCKWSVENNVLAGEGVTGSGAVGVIGACGNATLGAAEILRLSRHFLQIMREHPGRPILMLIDIGGQRMALGEELLGLHQYIAHLVKLQDLARRLGHKVIALVYGNAVAGGFVAFGLCAGQTYALPGGNTSVMALSAISRVTKLPVEYLDELGKTVPVFAPGVDNFFRAGGLHGIWTGDLNARLEQALKMDERGDCRAALGAQRGGRMLALEVARRIRGP